MNSEGEKQESYWISALEKGNSRALSYFFDRHYTSLCYFCNRLIQDQDQAKDIVSECFVKVWEKHTDFATAENLKAFLYISCRNQCLNYLRSLKRKTDSQQIYFDQLNLNEDKILHEIIQVEFLQILDEEIALLPSKCRDVFKLLFYEGKKTEEVAQQLGISMKTVRSHKANALEILKTAFLKKGISGTFYLFILFIINQR